jgi:hypothetical protein
MARFETVFFAACIVAWALVLLIGFAVVRPGTALGISLYQFFSLAAVSGWLIGNVFVLRQRLGGSYPRRMALAYLTGPPAFLFLLRAFEPESERAVAPFVALYATLIYWLFFAVPWTLRVR